MPGVCCVPGCNGYKKARSRGVVFHSLPSRDPERCRKWLKAIKNPRFEENTPTSKYRSIKVCSQHFKPEDYELDLQSKLLKTPPRKVLKPNVVPSVFSGNPEVEEEPRHMEGTSVSSLTTSVSDASSSASQYISIDSRAKRKAPRPPPSAELGDAIDSDECDDCVKKTKLSSIVNLTTTSEKDTGEGGNHSKTIVNDSCLMELFNKCQTCGQTINKKKMSHCGAQTKIRWSCAGGHQGVWMSSPPLWEAFPEIHLLTALSILFSGGTFKQFRKWAKHLHLNFMGHKIFHEVQKAYVNPEIKEVNRGRICMTTVDQQQPEARPHISDPLKKIKTQSERKQKSSLSSFDEVDVTMEQDGCSSTHNTESESTELRETAGADDGSSERSKVSECQENLQPSQKDTSQLKMKARELTSEQILQGNSKNTELKAQTPQHVVFNSQSFLVACPQITNSSEIVGSVGAPCITGNSFTVLPAAAEVCGFIHTPDIHQIGNNPVTLPSVLSPAVYVTSSEQLQSDASTSQTLTAPFPLPCFTVIGLESTETVKKQ